jgi:nucleotide-binding universal stress UspA family protein
MSGIVVGVDGSGSGKAALRFALGEATVRNAAVRAVTAWHLPVGAYGNALAPPPPNLEEELETQARRTLEQAIADARAGGADVEVEAVVREGPASQVLLAEARDAELLVVGSRGLGGFRGLLLGSVSQQCAHHAPCPLVIVPHAPELPGTGEGA